MTNVATARVIVIHENGVRATLISNDGSGFYDVQLDDGRRQRWAADHVHEATFIQSGGKLWHWPSGIEVEAVAERD